MRGLTLTNKEQSRIHVLNGVLEGKVTVGQAAGLMDVRLLRQPAVAGRFACALLRLKNDILHSREGPQCH